ncbi:M48 family metallopeptidase [Microbulbifer sp. CAU 1566]|uniref:M48 family metallopeptidase n=1 Tax=Microbulbifer sp. CAU 1566 TaxID=2933269 RepID=UPI002004F7A4|nr:SprT family zinc-dependent metalloprotease [Microbulbifer sp. CAU 1566]MCK7598646.1 M48 family metallopeptidase [Microbulbifer sp. CAU 1566]
MPASGELFTFEEVSYRLLRSPRRKRLGLVVTERGAEVRIPQRCAERHGHQFLRDNIQWVREQLSRAAQRESQVPDHHFSFGAHFPWLGASLELDRAACAADAGIRDGYIQLYSRSRAPDEGQIQAALQKLYQREALALLSDKSRYFAGLLGLEFASVKVRRTRSKWGHCTIRGELQYNWLVCLAPEPVVDYLVIHEVCHLRHHNHGREFWALVASLCPDYKRLRRWLKENGHRLRL